MDTTPHAGFFQLTPSAQFPARPPYLVLHIVPAMAHLHLLPGGWTEGECVEFARRQVRANRFTGCLVLGPDLAVGIETDGSIRTATTSVPSHSIVVGRLRPPRPIDDAEVRAQEELVMAWARERDARRGQGQFIFGDLRKGGRAAKAIDIERLAGLTPDGVLFGLERCVVCGDWKGECLDDNIVESWLVVRVSCFCENENRCARCGERLYERKLNANYYNELDGRIWHIPGFSCFHHGCVAGEAAGLSPQAGER